MDGWVDEWVVGYRWVGGNLQTGRWVEIGQVGAAWLFG